MTLRIILFILSVTAWTAFEMLTQARAQTVQFLYTPDTTYTTYGNMTWGSDGSSYLTYGNTTYGYGPNGQMNQCSTYGNQTYCN
jgi:hypothetical protein